jgi:outer membrane protein, heavy metal efflux system
MLDSIARAVSPFACALCLGTAVAADDDKGKGFRAVIEVEDACPEIVSLEKITALAMERNPALAQASFRIDAAQGKAWQAGLKPNPVLSVTGDELGDRQGAGGIWTAPQVSQEIVTGGKLRLARTAAAKDVDRASLACAAQRFALLGDIRQAYYDALALQTKIAILDELVDLSSQSVDQTKALLAAQQVSRLEVVQLEVEQHRLKADREAADRERAPVLRKLAAVAGLSELPINRVDGTLDAFPPDYDFEVARTIVGNHPDLHAAKLGVDRARLLVDRARAEPIPNVTVSAGYVRQNQNRSNDWMLGVSLPIPVSNRNQGNIHAALAELGEATREVDRVENSLQDRLATAFRDYNSAKARAELYKKEILPRARESYDLSLKAYRGAQFEYLRVVEAQRAVAQARLELVRALGEAWKAAAVISGLLMQDQWPMRVDPTGPMEESSVDGVPSDRPSKELSPLKMPSR